MATAAIPIGLMVASQVFQGASQDSQMHAAASVDDVNAQRSEMAGALEGQQVRDRERAVSGEAISAEAADGVSVGTGSPLDLLHQNAKEREYEILSRQYSAESQAQGLRVQAQQKRSAGTAALFGGILRAGASAFGGSSSLSNASRLAANQMPGGSAMPMPFSDAAGNW